MKNLICLSLCIISVSYSVYYASLGGFAGNNGALSKIGLTHPLLFCLWGMLTFCTLSIGIIFAMQKKYKTLFISLLGIAIIGMAFTLIFDFDYNNYIQYILHCTGSLVFSAIMGITVFLLFFLNKAYWLATASSVILITDLVLLIIFKETAFIELMPIFSGYIMLCIHNIRKEHKPIEVKQKIK